MGKVNLTLPISDLITIDNWQEIEVDAHEYKNDFMPFSNDKLNFYHSNMGIIDNNFLNIFNKENMKYLQKSDCKIFSCTFGPACEKVEIINGKYEARSRILSKNELKENVGIKVKEIRENFNNQIALENTNFLITSAYSYICDPNLISEIIRENDIYLILDLAHLKVTYEHFKFFSNNREDIYNFIDRFPLERCVEIHLSEPKKIDDYEWIDAHNLPQSEYLFDLLKYVLEKTDYKPYVAVEYYRDFKELKKVYERLRK